MLYMCIQQTQTVQCRQTRCIYVCKISGTYQQFLIDIAYYMQFISAILSPCNRWDNVQKKRLKTEARVTKKLSLAEYSCNTSERGREGQSKRVTTARIRRRHHTRPVYKRNDNGQTKKRWLQRSKQRCTFTHQSFTKIKSASEEPVNWTAGLEQQPAQHVEFVRVEGDWL